jgi:hypothetical protein
LFEDETVSISSSSFLSTFLVLEANVSETSLGVIHVERDFQGFNWTVCGKVGSKELISDWFFTWGLVEDVVVGKLFFVASKKLWIERKGSALESHAILLKLEVSHFIASFLVLDWVVDNNNCGIKRSEVVSSDLWSLLDDGSTFLSESLSDSLRSNVLLWKIVKIHIVSVSLEHFVVLECFFKLIIMLNLW